MAITEYQDKTMVNKHLQHFALGTKFLYVKDKNLYGWSEMLDLAAQGLNHQCPHLFIQMEKLRQQLKNTQGHTPLS